MAKWYEYGTPKHIIKPKVVNPAIRVTRDQDYAEHGDETRRVHPRSLMWKTGGEKIFRHSVRHPGIPSKNIPSILSMTRGFEEGTTALKQAIKDKVSRNLSGRINELGR